MSTSPTPTKNTYLYKEEYKPPFLAVLVVVFPIMPLFWRYKVEVTDDSLTFGYSTHLTSKTTPRSQIKEAAPLEHVNGLTQWGGWGIRLGRSGWGYISKNGGAVQVTLVDDSKDKDKSPVESTYVFSCENPTKVCELLNAGKKAQTF